MRKTKMFTAIFAALAMFSCQNEEGLISEGVMGEDTYAGVTVSFPKTMTKAADETAASTLESTVKSLGVYVIDNASNIMHSNVYESSEFTENAGVYTLNAALKTTTGTKNVYVVLNPSTELMQKINSTSFGIANPLVGSGDVFKLTDALTMSSVKTVSASLTTPQAAAAALAAPVEVSVQRNTAKVALRNQMAVATAATGGAIANLQFALTTQATKSYLIQQGGNLLTNVVTPATDIEAAAELPNYFSNYKSPGTYTAVSAKDAAYNILAGHYCTENVNAKNFTGNTTAAIIKAQFTPTDGTVVTAYNQATDTRTMGNLTPGTSFYVKKSDNSYWSAAAYISADVAADFSAEYVEGTGYYRIWVQDEAGERGVLRNNYYVMDITAINGPGSPVIPGTEEDITDPVEEDTYVDRKSVV